VCDYIEFLLLHLWNGNNDNTHHSGKEWGLGGLTYVGCNTHVHGSNTKNLSIYSYLYLILAKMLCLSYYPLCFLFNKIGEQEVGTGSAPKQGLWGWRVGREEVAQRNYTYIRKCKND
jgi:hypothetical protein